MGSITVLNKEELKKAKEQGYGEIIVSGDLAKNLKKAKKITKLGAVSLGVLGVSVAATPITGGLSLVAAAPIAAMTGAEIATIIAVSCIGLTVVIAIFKDYEEIDFSSDPPTLKLRKKQ